MSSESSWGRVSSTESDEVSLRVQTLLSICSLPSALGERACVREGSEIGFFDGELAFDKASCWSVVTNDEPDEVSLQMQNALSTCSLSSALGARACVREGSETCFFDGEVAFEEASSHCSEETDVPLTTASDDDFRSDADEAALVSQWVPALPAQEPSEVPVPRRSCSGRRCQKCGLASCGFGDTCASCRKVGPRGIGSIRQCVCCSAFFSGFHAACEDCQ